MEALEFFILQYPPTPALTAGGGLPAIDLTNPQRILRDDLGSINRAIERELLSFRTGDLTFAIEDRDGFCGDLFSSLGPSDRWQCLIRRGELDVFRGIILGKGSIKFDRKARSCEVTAYGASRALEDATAEATARTFGVTKLNANAGAGATSLTLDSTSGLVSQDVLHVTDQINKEDVTIKQVTSATVVQIETGTSNGYASGSPVTVQTPYPRYKPVETLARSLFAAAGVGVQEIVLNQSQFKIAAPTPINLNGLSLADYPRSAFCERTGRVYATVRGAGTYYQVNPEDDWTQEEATDKTWVDWSRYYALGETPPATILRSPVTGDDSTDPNQNWRNYCHIWGWNYKAATKRFYFIERVFEAASLHYHLSEQTTVDGTTWTAINRLITNLVGGDVPSPHVPRYTEYDPVRDIVYMCWADQTSPKNNFKYYDVGGGTQVNCKQGDDTNNHGYWGPVYVPDRDYVIVLRANALNGFSTSWEICAFRGSTRLWKRPFPNVLVKEQTGQANPTEPTVHPTITLRQVGGIMYCVVISDGAAQLVYSNDEFQTYTMRRLADPATATRFCGSVVLGRYRTFNYVGSIPKGYNIYAPFYAGVVPYLDMKGKSVAEALKQIAIVTNGVFWLDESLNGHLVARDLLPAGKTQTLDARILEQTEDLLWDQQAEHVSLSGGSISVTSGPSDRAGTSQSIQSEIIPNEAFGQLLADQYLAVFSPERKFVQATVDAADGKSYRPLDRVTIGADQYLVYEADEDLAEMTSALSLLEDA